MNVQQISPRARTRGLLRSHWAWLPIFVAGSLCAFCSGDEGLIERPENPAATIPFELEVMPIPEGFLHAFPASGNPFNQSNHAYINLSTGVGYARPAVWVPGLGGGITFIDELLSPEDLAQWSGNWSMGGINDLDEIVGSTIYSPTGYSRGFRFSFPGPSDVYAQIVPLDYVDPLHDTRAQFRQINNLGECLGATAPPGTDSDFVGAYWSATAGTLALPKGSYSQVWPRQITDSGLIVGYSTGSSAAVYWPNRTNTPMAIPYFAPGVNNLPDGIARGANDNGYIVGNSSNGVSGKGANAKTKVRAFRFRISPPQLTNLGDLGNANYSAATSINNQGEIIGSYGVTTKSKSIRYQGFYYQDDFGMIDLQSAVVNLPAGATIEPIGINNAGNILVRVGLNNGTNTVGVLRPTN